MNPFFADTSFFVAFFSKTDHHHEQASYWMKNLQPIVTTSWILVEVGNFLSNTPRRPVFLSFVEELKADKSVTIIPADEETFNAGLDLYSRRNDKSWSLTDCISFAVMEKLGLTDALTADHHFQQAGYRVMLT